MKVKHSKKKERCQLHTFASLQQDYIRFSQSGYKIENVKYQHISV